MKQFIDLFDNLQQQQQKYVYKRKIIIIHQHLINSNETKKIIAIHNFDIFLSKNIFHVIKL